MATSKENAEIRRKRIAKDKAMGSSAGKVANRGSSASSKVGSRNGSALNPDGTIAEWARYSSGFDKDGPNANYRKPDTINKPESAYETRSPITNTGGGFTGVGGSFGPDRSKPIKLKAGPFQYDTDYDSAIGRFLTGMGIIKDDRGQSADRGSSYMRTDNGGGRSVQRGGEDLPFNGQRGIGNETPFSGKFAMSPEEEILKQFEDLLSQQFERQQIDTSYLDNALQSKLGAINSAKDEANQFATTSGANLKNMYDAFQGNVRGRQADIQAGGDAAQSEVSSVFDQTIADSNARRDSGNAQREEMLQRLGIASAANAPDLANQAIEEGITNTQGSRDNRVSEIVGGTQRGIQNNEMFATALGAEGLQRQGDLSQQLQGILGGLRDSEVGARSDYANQMMGVQGDQQDRDYQQWLNKMAMGNDNLDRFINMNDQSESRAFDANQQAQQQQADIYMEQIKAASKGASDPQGYDGLSQASNPQTQRIFADIISQDGADPKNISDLLQRFDKNPAYWNAVTKDDFLKYITQYNQLGTQKTFGQ